ncbi:MAG: hypothetical protein A2Y24_07030 [Clostridiales bacterium GWE2_32_10]|nr:MAG: hypothetical protein A2Y24_07030 [Clostridiales bacterium GWE2_32_10]HBY20590.1 hypothetical protein [Clostridiales bacterium]
MNRMLTKLWIMAFSMMVMIPSVAFATSDVAKELGALAKNIAGVAQPVGAFFILMSVLMVGFNIIKNRDKAEDRTKAMESLLWLGIGAFIIGVVLTLGPAVAGLSGIDTSDLGEFKK